MWCPVEAGGVGGAGGAGGGGDVPCSRAKHAAAVLGHAVYVLFGRGAGGALPLRDCWLYHISSGRWERLRTRGEHPPALQEHTATPHESRLYVFGGEASLSTETPLWLLDTETLIWRKIPGEGGAGTRRRGRGGRGARPLAPTGRRGHSAHALNDCMLVYGGYKDLRGSTNELWAFHYESETWQAVRTVNSGPARHRHAGALHGARLYVHAGRCDLRAQADLWHYDTLARLWTHVRVPPKLAPAARCGHAVLPVGNYFYIFGGEVDGHPTNELWRFHFTSEMWERMAPSLQWPAARTDAVALLLAGVQARVHSAPVERGSGPSPRPEPPPPAGLLREISKLSALHIRRSTRCAYSVLGERDSTESLRDSALAKSRSAYVIDERQQGDGDESPREPPTDARLVYLDSDSESEARRRALPKSASVRFARGSGGGGVTLTTEEEGELSTSDYASAERVAGLAGFSNPHYLGPDVRQLTPDSGADLELRPLRPSPRRLSLLLLGGREPSHPAHMAGPLAMWTYRLV